MNSLGDDVDDATREGLRRGIWAERVVREGATDANAMLGTMLESVADVIGGFFGDLANFKRADVARAAKWEKQFQKQGSLPQGYRDLFGIRGADLNDHGSNVSKMLRTGQIANAGEAIDGALGKVELALKAALPAAGMKVPEANETAAGIVKVFKAVVAYMQTQTFLGGVKGILTDLVQSVVTSAQPLLFDGSVSAGGTDEAPAFQFDAPTFPAYTLRTSPELEMSVDRMMSWDDAGEQRYASDSRLAADQLDLMVNEYTALVQNLAYARAIAESGDTIASVLEFGGKNPYVLMAKYLAKIAKFVGTTHTIVAPALYVYDTASDGVRYGTYAAFGEEPPPEEAAAAPRAGALASVALQPADPRSAQIDESAGAFREAIGSLAGALRADDIGAAIDVMHGTGPDGYDATRRAWERLIRRVLQQSLAPADVLESGSYQDRYEDLQVQVAEAGFIEADLSLRLMDFLGGVLTREYSGPADPGYLSERNGVAAAADLVVSHIDRVADAARELVASAPQSSLGAVLIIEVEPLEDASGRRLLAGDGQTFTLQARLVNAGGETLSGVSAVVEAGALAPGLTVRASPGLELPAGGDLAPGDEVSVTWRLRFDGRPDARPVLLAVRALEDGAAPAGFASAGQRLYLFPDPSVFDRDLDLLPDDYEALHGLDPGRDDAGEDVDGDGLTNLEEFARATDPRVADSDGDGLSDGEELAPGEDGAVTDPRSPDSDGDGTRDADDGQPLNPASTEASPPAAEPTVAVSRQSVTLSPAQPAVLLTVTNAGEGSLTWAAEPADGSLVVVGPGVLETRGPGLLAIAAAPGVDFTAMDGQRTVVRVVDVSGLEPDAVEVAVQLSAVP